jgi:hypothetical protein
LKAPSLLSFPSRYHFEETRAAQQAQMLIAIKLQMAPDGNGAVLFPFRYLMVDYLDDLLDFAL